MSKILLVKKNLTAEAVWPGDPEQEAVLAQWISEVTDLEYYHRPEDAEFYFLRDEGEKAIYVVSVEDFKKHYEVVGTEPIHPETVERFKFS